MVGILAYIYQENVQDELEMSLNNTLLTTYKISDDKTQAVDFLQENVRYSYFNSLFLLKYFFF